MAVDTLQSPERRYLKQFSIFADNKVGRLNEILISLAKLDIHVMALCSVDTTDNSIVRLVVDYWEPARDYFHQAGLAHSLCEVVAVELDTEADLSRVTCALVQAEINIHYTYPLLTRPQGKCGLVLRLEDNELGCDVLAQSGIRVLDLGDIAR